MLGQRIHELRQAMGWSQVELARRLSLSKQTISNWENDNIQPSIEILIRLARVFNVTTDYLLGLEDILRLDISGLPTDVVAHFSLLIEDYRNKKKITNKNRISIMLILFLLTATYNPQSATHNWPQKY